MKTIVMFYNKDLVDMPVDTWAEMKAFAKEFNDPAKNKFACLWQAVEPYYDICRRVVRVVVDARSLPGVLPRVAVYQLLEDD